MINEQASKAYIEAQFEIDQQIEKLKDKLAKHNEVENVSWSHVGDLNYILNQLKELNGESNG